MNSKKVSGIFMPRTDTYMWSILILLVIITILKWQIAVPGIALFLILIYYNVRTKFKQKGEITQFIENLTITIDSTTKNTLLNFPTPLVVTNIDGGIIWYNSSFKKLYDGANLLENTITTFVEDLHPGTIINEGKDGELLSQTKQVTINGVHYKVLCNFTKAEKKNDPENYILILYFIDITELVEIKKKYLSERIVTGLVTVDNYDDLMQGIGDTERQQAITEIEKKIALWMSQTSGIVKKFDRDKYLIIFEMQYLKIFEEGKFEILDSIKEINVGNKFPITLSIGIGLHGKTLSENLKIAGAALDVALGRGGDHVAIKHLESYSFFGGKAKELEKKTKVKARVVAYALKEMIDKSTSVFIMGHENGDIDSLGASLGLFGIANSRGNRAFIVLEKPNASIEALLSKIQKNPDYEGVIIGKVEALERIDKKALLIVVDTHKPSFTEVPELIGKTDKTVVIDHHRRGAEYIQDTIFTYQETYASSTSELVSEILQYMGEDFKIKSLEVEALYAGIVVDTKNFTLKTGVRTFEAASYLRSLGADTSSVKHLFQNDMETYKSVSAIVRDAEMMNEEIAISASLVEMKNPQLIAAKSADELLNLTGIGASFVLSYSGNDVFISGRSLGEINVQMIMEKIGGGGHMTVAGAQLSNTTVVEAREKVKAAIREYLNETHREAGIKKGAQE